MLRNSHRNGLCCSLHECGIESSGQSSRCQPPHRLKPQSRALMSPSLISHISDSCVCLLRRARLQNRFLPLLQSSAAAEWTQILRFITGDRNAPTATAWWWMFCRYCGDGLTFRKAIHNGLPGDRLKATRLSCTVPAVKLLIALVAFLLPRFCRHLAFYFFHQLTAWPSRELHLCIKTIRTHCLSLTVQNSITFCFRGTTVTQCCCCCDWCVSLSHDSFPVVMLSHLCDKIKTGTWNTCLTSQQRKKLKSVTCRHVLHLV